MNKKVMLLIICNEFCERYCFYGYRSILFAFLRSEFLFTKKKATFIVHMFVLLCYLFTLVGGMISDMILGKYKTILYLSILYFTGTTFVTYSSVALNSALVLYAGLFMIALGTGGIKPCVAAFGGDQIKGKEREKDLTFFFNFFYFAINLGSMLSTFISPILTNLECEGKKTCYPAAFGSSSVLLLLSILLFYVGSSLYVKHIPKVSDFLTQISNVFSMLFSFDRNQQPSAIAEEHHIEQADENYNIMRILKLFGPITFFWMLFDQQATTWVEQGFKMKNTSMIGNTNIKILSSQMQTFNSIFILLFIPLFSRVIYPFIEYIGIKLTPIKKMACGIFLASVSFIISAYIEHMIYIASLKGEQMSILWQLPQYLILTAGEIMLNMTGLEFAYSEAPESMKTLILACWLLTVTFGNFFVILYSTVDILKFVDTQESEKYNFLIYASMGLVATYVMFKLEKGYNKSK
ncbi:Solute carrier family 15 member 1 [Nosema granulosis]|uniref:Solute carrier family 15 member 1 n=1 Tax=Nosema granulosis TaxID=83296 RepID=A0A9P6H0C1_9MICR|nr:Solute carrier family 15 member 1 [Nosema granulosis]